MKLVVVAGTGIIFFLVGFLFYKHLVIAIFCSGLSLLALPVYRRFMYERRIRTLGEQFRYLLYSLSSLLAAGRSVENAFRMVEADLRTCYSSVGNLILPEMERVNGKVGNGETIEKALHEFAERTNQGDIRNFAEVFSICKRTGGDLIEVVRKTAHMIAEKMEVEQEIHVITAQKKFEARAMAVVPFVIVGLLAFSSPDYMDPLYAGVGRLIMTISLMMFGLSYYWLISITQIRL